jgi:hypothetical protein
MSRANTIVCPGGKMDLAMQLIFTPLILRLIERRKEALARRAPTRTVLPSALTSALPALSTGVPG